MPVGQTLANKANNAVGYRSTMRLCGNFPQFRGLEEGPQADGGPGERVDASLLAVDDADGGRDPQADLAERIDGLDRSAAGGDHVLDEADAVAVLEGPLDPVRSAVVLGPASDDHERQLE